MPFKKINLRQYLIKLLLILNIFIIYSCLQVNHDSTPKAVKGVLDIRNWDFKKNGVIKLDGEWEFFWKEFLEPTSNPAGDAYKRLLPGNEINYINVPGKWNDFPVNGQPVGARGFATYRLKIILPNCISINCKDPKDRLNLEIKLVEIGTAYKFWINGVLYSKAGKPGISEDSSQLGFNPKLVALQREDILILPDQTRSIELIFHVSNFFHRSGGLWYSINLGDYPTLYDQERLIWIFDFFLLGSILIIGLYHLGLYLLRKKDQSPLWFGLNCILICIRIPLVNGRYLESAFPDYSSFFLFIEYIDLLLLIVLFANFIFSLYPQEFSKIIKKLITISGFLYTFLIILLPTFYYTNTLTGIHIYILISGLYAIYVLIIAAFQERQGAKTLLGGFVFFFITIIHDMLHVQLIIESKLLLSPFGLFGFIFSQAYLLSVRFSNSFIQSEKLAEELGQKSNRLEETTIELKELTDNLEVKVQERTQDLEETKKEIEVLNEISKSVNSSLNLTDIMEFILNFIRSNFDIDLCGTFIVDKKNNKILVQYFPELPEQSLNEKNELLANLDIPLDQLNHVHGYVYHTKKSLYTKELAESVNDTEKKFIQLYRLKSFLCTPLLLNNEVIGFLDFTNYDRIMNLSESEISTLEKIAEQVTSAIQNTNLLLETEKQKKETEELNLLIKSLNEEIELRVIMKKVHLYIKENYDIHYYWLGTTDKNLERVISLDTLSPDFLTEVEKEKVNNISTEIQNIKGGHAAAFKFQRPFYIQRPKKAGMTINELWMYETLRFESLLVIPLILQNKPIGFLDLYNVGKMNLSKNDLTKLSILAEQLAGIIHSSNLLKQVQEEKEKALVAKAETEKAKNEIEKLAESRKRLSIIGQKVAGIVHDIKNPIASIKGLAERLNSDTIKPEKRERNIKMITNEMERLSDMVYEILDFSKGKLSLEISRVNLSHYLSEILQFQQTLLDYNSIRGRTNFQFEGEIDLDIARMRRVLSNLIQNSIEVMYDGKKDYYIQLSTSRDEDYCTIRLEDNGPGLPGSIQEKIFEAFATEGKAKGTGLGLFMSKWIIEAHGGELGFETTRGEGTTFIIKIPINQKEK
ncbi:MAG: 7TM diverse intracellular signaling domain-containing protein [Leptospiraceae bacterium]|nr:7TM diverse intracellular signaling domain-containing protein [Leptospiraceae bacterium]